MIGRIAAVVCVLAGNVGCMVPADDIPIECAPFEHRSGKFRSEYHSGDCGSRIGPKLGEESPRCEQVVEQVSDCVLQVETFCAYEHYRTHSVARLQTEGDTAIGRERLTVSVSEGTLCKGEYDVYYSAL